MIAAVNSNSPQWQRARRIIRICQIVAVVIVTVLTITAAVLARATWIHPSQDVYRLLAGLWFGLATPTELLCKSIGAEPVGLAWDVLETIVNAIISLAVGTAVGRFMVLTSPDEQGPPP